MCVLALLSYLKRKKENMYSLLEMLFLKGREMLEMIRDETTQKNQTKGREKPTKKNKREKGKKRNEEKKNKKKKRKGEK